MEKKSFSLLRCRLSLVLQFVSQGDHIVQILCLNVSAIIIIITALLSSLSLPPDPFGNLGVENISPADSLEENDELKPAGLREQINRNDLHGEERITCEETCLSVWVEVELIFQSPLAVFDGGRDRSTKFFMAFLASQEM